MTPDNLLSGLIGALAGGLIVGALGFVGVLVLVRADDRRWGRENRAGSRLVYHEIVVNIGFLALRPFTAMVFRTLSRSVWDAEQVRVASYLPPDEVDKVVNPYVRLVTMQTVWGRTPDDELSRQLAEDLADPQSVITDMANRFIEARDLLAQRLRARRRRWTDRWHGNRG